MTQISLLGIPFEAGCGRRGAAMGPAAYRTAGLAEELEALGFTVEDLGDVVPEQTDVAPPSEGRAKAYAEVAGWTRAIATRAHSLALGESLPVYLGGDHGLAFGTLAGHLTAAKEQGRPQFVLWLDAHSDFNTIQTSPSGNMHGMPLAFACGLPGFGDLLGRPLPAALDPDNLCLIGLRSVDVEERKLLQASGAAAHDMRAIDEHGIQGLLAPFLAKVKAAGGDLHVSLDVDFIEPTVAPAVGTTVPGGATFREAHHVMELLHDSGLVTSLDLVELNPFLDERGRTARLMVDLTASLFGRCVLDRPTASY